jgi:hypothetical protein
MRPWLLSKKYELPRYKNGMRKAGEESKGVLSTDRNAGLVWLQASPSLGEDWYQGQARTIREI